MTAKTYLSQARFLDARITSKIQQINSLNELATNCSVVLSDMPRNPNRGGSRMEDAVCKMIDLQTELNHDINTLVDLKKEIMNTIHSVSNVEHQTLLEKRYLCFISWEQIAVDLCYSIQHTYRMHDAALKEITVILNHESKCDRMRVSSCDIVIIARKLDESLVGEILRGFFYAQRKEEFDAKMTKETVFTRRLSEPNG